MSVEDDRIAHSLGQIIGRLDSLHAQFHDYIDRHDGRHEKIDVKLEEHAATMNQARGARGAMLAVAGFIGGAAAWVAKKLWP